MKRFFNFSIYSTGAMVFHEKLSVRARDVNDVQYFIENALFRFVLVSLVAKRQSVDFGKSYELCLKSEIMFGR